MKRLRRQASKQPAQGLRVLLSLLILAQGMLPLQAHTVLDRDALGHVVVVCAWQGPRSETLVLPAETPAAPADRLTPAMLFSEALAAADLPQLPPLPVAPYSLSDQAPDRVIAPPASARLSAHPIRAPPTGLRVTA